MPTAAVESVSKVSDHENPKAEVLLPQKPPKNERQLGHTTPCTDTGERLSVRARDCQLGALRQFCAPGCGAVGGRGADGGSGAVGGRGAVGGSGPDIPYSCRGVSNVRQQLG